MDNFDSTTDDILLAEDHCLELNNDMLDFDDDNLTTESEPLSLSSGTLAGDSTSEESDEPGEDELVVSYFCNPPLITLAYRTAETTLSLLLKQSSLIA